MSHHHAHKRAASRRRHAPTTRSHRPSPTPPAASTATTPQLVPPVLSPVLPPASATSTHTRTAAHMQAQTTPTLPPPAALSCAHDSLPSHSHTPQPDQAAQDHRDRRAHPDQAALKERAFALACIGHRSPAIAARLGVSERTIRHWNSTTLRTLALDATGLSSDLDSPADLDSATSPDAPTASSSASSSASEAAAPAPALSRMEYHRALAIERQLDIAVTARAAYDRLMAQHDYLLAQYIAACDANIAAPASAATATAATATAATATAATTPAPDETSPAPALPAAVASMARLIPQLASSASRQLQIAQAAHREVARLQGVPTYAQTDARLAAEYDARLAEQAPAPAEEQGGRIPIRFIDPED